MDAVGVYQQAQAELATSQAAVVAAQQEALQVRQRADEAREVLAKEIREARAAGMTIADLVRVTPYSREGIRKILDPTRGRPTDDAPE